MSVNSGNRQEAKRSKMVIGKSNNKVETQRGPDHEGGVDHWEDLGFTEIERHANAGIQQRSAMIRLFPKRITLPVVLYGTERNSGQLICFLKIFLLKYKFFY